jgi:hypothetical protein
MSNSCEQQRQRFVTGRLRLMRPEAKRLHGLRAKECKECKKRTSL